MPTWVVKALPAASTATASGSRGATGGLHDPSEIAICNFSLDTTSRHYMQQIIDTSLPALIALLGTVLTVLVGYVQWKRERSSERHSIFHKEKRAAYITLWSKLEDLHIKIVTRSVSPDVFEKHLVDINTFVIKSSLYLSSSDAQLATKYVETVYRMKKTINEKGNQTVQRRVTNTSVLVRPPKTVQERIREIAKSIGVLARQKDEQVVVEDVIKEANFIRSKLIGRFQKVLKGYI